MKKNRVLLIAGAGLLLAACDGGKGETVNLQSSAALASSSSSPVDEPLSPDIPPKEPFGGTVSIESLQRDFDIFSWQSFIALNWPADAGGNPLTGVTIGEQPGAMRVWQYYKESRDIFLPEGAKPPGWDQPFPPPASCGNDATKPLLRQVGKTPNVLDESAEPFQTGPLIDQNGQYTRYEILTNQVMFDYILDNDLYSKAGQTEFDAKAEFPFGSDTEVGSIMLKAAWKVMGEGDDPSLFYTTEAYVYNNPHENSGVTAACQLQRVGLVGFHIGTKVENNPQWIWSTFEHVNNAPTQGQTPDKDHYNYYSPDCADGGVDCTAVNEPPPRPWNPANKNTPPSQIERVIPIADDTAELNRQYQQKLQAAVPGTVWANYELISTQWPTAAGDVTDETGVPAPTFLANTTLETYIQGRVKQTSSSCIQCHNNAAMTNGKKSDFTYLLERAQ
ncbi:hypothetical protein [uncultured Gilvimarinus sp.]|uniref:hypothetical protein n=1 Tax=uncultured Gilvimarinus sp. TaxID=1689143 RepID=UPI0030EB9895